MRKLSVIVLLVSGLFLIGCDSQPAQNYTYVQTRQPNSSAPIEAVTYNGQNTVGRACLDNQNRVVDDHYCDQQWIEQQRQIAQQQHNDQMLQDLMLYHFMFGGSVNNGIYTGGLTYLPPGYTYMPYSSYNTYIVRTRPRVIHNTIVVNPSVRPASPWYSPRVSSRVNQNGSVSQTVTRTDSWGNTHRVTTTTNPYTGVTKQTVTRTDPYGYKSTTRSYSGGYGGRRR